MSQPFICNSAIVIDWEGGVYLCPNNDEDNILAARFDVHDTTVTGRVIDVTPEEHTARIKVDSFPADITVYDECAGYLDVGVRVMFVGDLRFCYEEEER